MQSESNTNSNDSSVKVAVRIKPLTVDEASTDDTICINVVPGENQVKYIPISSTLKLPYSYFYCS